ncbi:MAG: MFS transporter [Rickettsiaceae bacterium]|nr:MFS transporter [Rickettsiaceae bacterium]
MKKHYKNFAAGVLGNILDRYDIALYGLMATFIAPVYFPGQDPLVSTIKAYGVMALGMFTRPIGALIFGQMAMVFGPKRVLVIALFGVAISTGLLGMVPSYEQIGPSATFFFICIRVMQGVFATGEHVVAPFFIIQTSPIKNYTRSSTIFTFSTMLGVVMASIASAIVSSTSDPSYYWRYPYFAGSITAFAGLYLRISAIKELEETYPKIHIGEILSLVNKNKLILLRIALVASFSYVTYVIPFVFMNSFVPYVTNVNISEMLHLNSFLLVLDTALIPIFGFIAEKYDRKKFMASMSFLTAILVLPLFYFMKDSSFEYIMFVRIVIIFTGLAYLAPLHAWYYSLFKKSDKYLLVGIGCSLGDELLGKNSTTICLFLWHYFHSPIAPALYIFAISILATCALLFMPEPSKT